MITNKVFIHEVGPRDGLQVEEKTVPLEEKIRWIEGLCPSGIDIIQLGSFVNPAKVPQMTDTDALFQHFTGKNTAGVVFSGLVLNEKGVERGLACEVEMFCMGVSASETHSRKNTGMTSAEALEHSRETRQRGCHIGIETQQLDARQQAGHLALERLGAVAVAGELGVAA